jgi:hypothetical protein
MRAGDKYPAVDVYLDAAQDPPVYWLADGFHRLDAADDAGLEEFDADVYNGDRRAALLHSLGANKNHGLRRSRADARKAVERMLRDAEWSTWSDREIGRQVGVDHKTVAKVRADLTGEIPQSTIRTGGDGRTIDTAKIGRNTAAEASGASTASDAPPDAPEPGSTPRSATVAPAPARPQSDAVPVNGRHLDPEAAPAPGRQPEVAVDELVTDDEGTPVPAHLVEVFQLRAKFSAAEVHLRRAVQEIRQVDAWQRRQTAAGAPALDPLAHNGLAGRFLATDRSVERLADQVTGYAPSVLCERCNGAPGGCKLCGGLGWFSLATVRQRGGLS